MSIISNTLEKCHLGIMDYLGADITEIRTRLQTVYRERVENINVGHANE